MQVGSGVASSIPAYSMGTRLQRSVGSEDQGPWDGAVVELGAKSGGYVVRKAKESERLKAPSTPGRLRGYENRKELFDFVTRGLLPVNKGHGGHTQTLWYTVLNCHHSTDDTGPHFHRWHDADKGAVAWLVPPRISTVLLTSACHSGCRVQCHWPLAYTAGKATFWATCNLPNWPLGLDIYCNSDTPILFEGLISQRRNPLLVLFFSN